MTFYELRNKIQLEAYLELLNEEGQILQEGINGETLWEDSFLDYRVDLIIPGIHTKIILNEDPNKYEVIRKNSFFSC